MTQAETVIEAYFKQLKLVGRTRFNPGKDAKKQTDPALPHTKFFKYPDGSGIRFEAGDAEVY